MKALHFGAGNIGRGFIGKLLADAQIEVTFADVNQQIIDLLATRHQYPVQIVGEREITETVSNVNAIYATDPAVIDLIAQVDLITTAVGPQVLAKIANTVSQGLIKRYNAANQSPLNIIACENMVRGSSQLQQYILDATPQSYHRWIEQHVGFVDSAVDRIVPPTTSANGDPLAVTVETFAEWIVDRNQFKGPLPIIAGMEPTDNLLAFVERKLFTLNTGHAITAYLGQRAGLQTIRDAILTTPIRQVVKGAMEESGVVLIKRYGFDTNQHAAYINKILGRFENPYLHDDVDRVGRQPLRKLSVSDRLIKPLLGTIEYALPHSNLITGIAAALSYRNAQDPQAQELERMLADIGIKPTIAKLTEFAEQSEITTQIAAAYLAMQKG